MGIFTAHFFDPTATVRRGVSLIPPGWETELTPDECRAARLLWDSLQRGDEGALKDLEKATWKVRAAILFYWDKRKLESGQLSDNPFE